MNQIIDLLLVSFVFLLFASIYRKRKTERVLLWLVGWFFVLIHFLALCFQPAGEIGQTAQGVAALSALVLCGICFVLSLETFRLRPIGWAVVFWLIAVPWLAAVTLAALPHLWLPGLAASASAGELGTLVLALAFYRKSWRLLSLLLLLVAACSAWLGVALRHGDANTVVEVMLTQCFALNAVLFSFEERRLSVGTATVGAALYLWGLVWVAGEALSRVAPQLAVHPEVWNLPKYLVATGMILVLLEEEIRAAKLASEQYRLLFAGNPHPMWMYDRDSLAFLQVNDAAVAQYGYTRDQFLQMTLLDVQPLGCREAPPELRTAEPRQLSGPWDHRRRDGTIVQADIASHPLLHEGREVTFAMMQDVTERQRLHEQLVLQAQHDILTGLPNRALFEERTRRTLAHACLHQHKSALLSLDLDRFKQINDTYGYAAGDLCLIEIGRRLGARLGAEGTLARTGGEDFALLLDAIEAPVEAERVAEEILQALKAPVQVEGHEIELAASIGIAIYPEDGEDAATLWRDADTAMHQAKQRGGAQYLRVSKAISVSAAEASDVEVSLRRALRAGDFELQYQPLMTLDGVLDGLEALVRSCDPKLDGMSPGRFIPIAEKSGLIVPLGNWVLEEVCRQSREWINQGLPPVRVAVNLSPLQLTRPDFSQKVMETLNRYRLSPETLEFEVTESTLMPETRQALDQIDALANMGIRFSVDDFGTGYSSLARLHQLPVDALKIDQSFIERIAEPKGTFPIVQAIISLAHSLGMQVIAEGVENEAQMARLRQLGCDRIQGYLFEAPLPAAQTTRYLRSIAGSRHAVA